MCLQTGEVIAFAQTSFWLVIHNDPEAHGAADDAAVKRIFSWADQHGKSHEHTSHVGLCRALNLDLKKKKKKKNQDNKCGKDCFILLCIETIYSYQG